jgi:hypothetical protein
MTPAGMEKIRERMSEKFVLPPDIVAALKRDPQTWKNFQRFPKWYQRIRIGWLDASRNHPSIFESRLRYFLKMTKRNKRYGQVNDSVGRDAALRRPRRVRSVSSSPGRRSAPSLPDGKKG